MSEIEKLYKNVGVKPVIRDNAIGGGYYIEHQRVEDYPPFAAEKQLELIKWLMCKKQTIQVELRLYENDYCISHITECEDNDAVEYVETGRKNTFDEALAELVNELWQDLTPEEKQQVKGILE